MNFAVCPSFSWPKVPVEIPFRDLMVVLSPQTSTLACIASIFDPDGFEFDDGATILSKFLSCLTWSKRAGIEVHFASGSNDPAKPGLLGKGTFSTSAWADVDPWHQLYLPTPSEPKASLAIALFREGLMLNSEPFAFLSFFKILNVVFPSGALQEAWINNHLNAIRHGQEFDRLTEIRAQHADIGKYLYVQGRCAVAHAHGTPIADPDNYSDLRRLRDDLPLIKAIAESCIERELGLPTEDTFLATHRNSMQLPPEYLVPRPGPNGRIRYVST